MAVTDSRERYDDLLVTHKEESLDEEAFADLRESEAVRSGWVAVGAIVDDDGRVLLAYHGDDASWLLPGGAVAPGESLAGELVREVREETGIAVDPVRPQAIFEYVGRHDGETAGFRTVAFEATPISTAPGDDLGEAGKPIEDARWFETLPMDVYRRKFAERVLAACRDGGEDNQ